MTGCDEVVPFRASDTEHRHPEPGGDDERKQTMDGGTRQETATVTIGLLVDPGLPTEIAQQLVAELPETLNQRLPQRRRWSVAVATEELSEVDAPGDRLVERAAQRREEEGWDYVVCLTDLPLHREGQPVVAELSHSHRAAVLALPAFGGVRPERQAKELIVQLIAELLEPEETSSNRGTRQPAAPGAMPLRRTTPPDDDIDLRLTTTVGGWRLLTGMVGVNRPWRLVFGLRSALAAAVATAAFGVVTSSVWLLAGAISVPRLWLATAISLATIVIWLIVYHDLWQRVPSDRPDLTSHVRLYNTATVLTLLVGVVISYLVLLVGTILTAVFIINPEVLSETLQRPLGLGDYVKLGWLVSSLATIGGALGSGLDSDDAVRTATYGSREQAAPRSND